MHCSRYAGMLPTNVTQGHLETTDRTITLVDMARNIMRNAVRGTSTKAVETAATKAERGKSVAVSETHHTGGATVIYLSNILVSYIVPDQEHGAMQCLQQCALGLTLFLYPCLFVSITPAAFTSVASTHMGILLWQLESRACLLQGKQAQRQTTQQQTRAPQAPQQKS